MSNVDKSISKRLIFAIVLTAITLVTEVIGGLWSNSLALLSDAGHVFLDLFALMLSLAAIKLAAQPPNELHSYGWHRAEVLASLINGLTVTHTTIQFDCSSCNGGPLMKELNHTERQAVCNGH